MDSRVPRERSARAHLARALGVFFAIALLAALLAGSPSPARALGFTFSTLEAPNVSGLIPRGISDRGDTRGGYDDGGGPFSGTPFRTFDVPPSGSNDHDGIVGRLISYPGGIVGADRKSGGRRHGAPATVPITEPSSLLLLGAGLAVLALSRRRAGR